MSFEHIIGHDDLKRYFDKALSTGHIAHSYIFEGIEGVGKKTMAMEVAKRLLCQGGGVKPCGRCPSCIQVEAHSHADVTWIERDTKITKIDTVRERLVNNMEIKPIGPYKIVIIEEADTLNIGAQNAILKTLEEPPSYGVIILITQNTGNLLPTIISRCVNIKFNPLSQQKIMNYLQDRGLSYIQQQVYAQFSEGSIGKADKLLEDESFLQDRELSVTYLQRLDKANLIALYDLAKEIVDQKDKIPQLLDFWELWYRDLALQKSTQTKALYYLDYESSLLDSSTKLTYNKISMNIDAVKDAKKQINQNVYAMFVIENLLLKLKERKK